MTQLLIIILDDLSRLPDLLQTWHDIGIPGVTILESVGGYRARGWLSRVGLEGLEHLFDAKEVRRRTLLTVMDDEDLLAQAVAEAERIVGGFERPNSGILLVVPVGMSRGLVKDRRQESENKKPAAMGLGATPASPVTRLAWEKLRATPVEQTDIILDLEPPTVTPETPLNDVAQAMLDHPNVHIACVVAEDGRLIGLIKLRALADDLFFHISPEEFLTEVTDLEHVMAFANKNRARTAADAMQPAVWVKPSDTVVEAFKKMHEHDLTGLPVVDNRYRVIGSINLSELLAICAKSMQPSASSQKE